MSEQTFTVGLRDQGTKSLRTGQTLELHDLGTVRVTAIQKVELDGGRIKITGRCKSIMKPKELEKRLANAYESGKKDGYVQGIQDTHEGWMWTVRHTRHIGPKRQMALLSNMKAEAQRRMKANDVEVNPLYKQIRAELDHLVLSSEEVIELIGYLGEGHKFSLRLKELLNDSDNLLGNDSSSNG